MTDSDPSDRMLPEADDRYRWVFKRAPIAPFAKNFSAVRHWINRRVTSGPHLFSKALLSSLVGVRATKVGARRVYVGPLDPRGCGASPSCCSGSEKPLLRHVVGRRWHPHPGQEPPLEDPSTFGPTRQGENDLHPADLEAGPTSVPDIGPHGLKSPLTVVLGFAESLRSNTGAMSESERTELAITIADQPAAMSDIVEDYVVTRGSRFGPIAPDGRMRGSDGISVRRGNPYLASRGMGCIDDPLKRAPLESVGPTPGVATINATALPLVEGGTHLDRALNRGVGAWQSVLDNRS